MLNPFPELLWLGFFAPTIIRIVAGGVFLYTGYICWQRRGTIGATRFPIIGHGGWIAWLAIVFYVATGAMLFLGYYTQYAALLGMAGSLKGLLFAGRYKGVFFYQRSTYILLFAICASLLISGAGAYAFDLPL